MASVGRRERETKYTVVRKLIQIGKRTFQSGQTDGNAFARRSFGRHETPDDTNTDTSDMVFKAHTYRLVTKLAGKREIWRNHVPGPNSHPRTSTDS